MNNIAGNSRPKRYASQESLNTERGKKVTNEATYADDCSRMTFEKA